MLKHNPQCLINFPSFATYTLFSAKIVFFYLWPEGIGVSQKGSRKRCLPVFFLKRNEKNGRKRKKRKKTEKNGKKRTKRKKTEKNGKNGRKQKENKEKTVKYNRPTSTTGAGLAQQSRAPQAGSGTLMLTVQPSSLLST